MRQGKFHIRRLYSFAQQQRGSFMLFTLVIIALLTSVSVVGMQNTIQASRLSQSYNSHSLAQQRAQNALFKAYSRLSDEGDFKVNSNNQPLQSGLYPQLIYFENRALSAWRYVDDYDLWRNKHYANIHTLSDSGFANHGYLSSYIIEKMLIGEKNKALNLYRITAKGYGLSINTQVMLQAVVNIDEHKRQLSWATIH